MDGSCCAVRSLSNCTKPLLYLIQSLLQVWGAHAVRHVPVGRVGEEKLPLGRQRCTDVLLALNVLLAAVHHANVACGERGSGQGSARQAKEPRCPLFCMGPGNVGVQMWILPYKSLTDEVTSHTHYSEATRRMQTLSTVLKSIASVWRKKLYSAWCEGLGREKL